MVKWYYFYADGTMAEINTFMDTFAARTVGASNPHEKSINPISADQGLS